MIRKACIATLVFVHCSLFCAQADDNQAGIDAAITQVKAGNKDVLAQPFGPRKDLVIHYAAKTGDAALLTKIIEIGGDVNSQNTFGATPLHYALNKDVAVLLINHRAKVNAVDHAGHQPIHSASGGGRIDVITELLAAGADVNAKDDSGWTALHWAKDISTLKFLVDHGADKSAKSPAGETPRDSHPKDDQEIQNYLKSVGIGQ